MDVKIFRYRGGEDGTGGGAELEVGDAVFGEVLEDGEGGVFDAGNCGDEFVDVGGEEGEEALDTGVSVNRSNGDETG